MDRSAAQATPAEEVTFRDGLGDRFLVRDHTGRPMYEALHVRADLSAVPAFEYSLTERLTDLQNFEHPAFVPVKTSTRLPGVLPHSIITSAYTGGTRLSEVLSVVESRRQSLPTSTALTIIRDLLEAIAALHRLPGDVAHGALGPER